MIYLTYGDTPSGVYSSQVSDVLNYLDREWHVRVRLVAFVSLRGFIKSRKKIKSEVKRAVVLPALPKLNWWQPNLLVLGAVCILLGEKKAIARGVLACNLALWARSLGLLNTVCYDGRGAIAAEWTEYTVALFRNIKRNIVRLETNAILRSDFRIAVSQKLVDHWHTAFGYRSTRHVVIPCTLHSGFLFGLPAEQDTLAARAALGVGAQDILFIYAGSVSGWQSIERIASFMTPLLRERPDVRLLFLSGKHPLVDSLVSEFPGQVFSRWIPHDQVQGTLAAGDYGILLREQTITNRVAAPTKFAEYLSAGLRVLISAEIGDYSEFVRQHDCGTVVDDGLKFVPAKPAPEQKAHCAALARRYFSKESQKAHYRELIDAIAAAGSNEKAAR